MARIEFHPQNGNSPWVIRAGGIWYACRTEADAKAKLPDFEFLEGEQWSRSQIEAMRAQREGTGI